MRTKKWQRDADAGSKADELRREVVSSLHRRLAPLGVSRSALGLRAGLGASYVYEMALGKLNPTLRSISRLVAVMDELEGDDSRILSVIRELGLTVEDAHRWVRAARERIAHDAKSRAWLGSDT